MPNISGAGTPTINAVQVVQQSADPTALPPSGAWKVYQKASGLYVVDNSGQIYRWGSPVIVSLAGPTDTGGGLGSWQNPEAGTVLVNRLIVNVTVVAAAACTLDAGTTTVNATTLSDTLLDGIDIHSAIGVFDNLLAANAGTNGKTALSLAPGKWITFSTASGASASFVGKAYIWFNPV